MQALRKLCRLEPADRGLLVKALCLLWCFRLALWVLPFRAVRSAAERLGAPGPDLGVAGDPYPQRVAWAVRVAAKYLLPGARTCLVQAFAAQVLLTRGGCPARLRLGVAREGAGGLQAHAWVESQGMIVTGGDGVAAGYEPLAAPGEGGA